MFSCVTMQFVKLHVTMNKVIHRNKKMSNKMAIKQFNAYFDLCSYLLVSPWSELLHPVKGLPMAYG